MSKYTNYGLSQLVDEAIRIPFVSIGTLIDNQLVRDESKPVVDTLSDFISVETQIDTKALFFGTIAKPISYRFLGAGNTVTIEGFLALGGDVIADFTGPGLTVDDGVLTYTNANSMTTVDLETDVTGILPSLYGGTGLDSSSAQNGYILIGNGSGFAINRINEGTGIDIAVSAGGIEVGAELATHDNHGVATFDATYFTINEGDVSVNGDSLDFTQFKDALTLDASTSINSPAGRDLTFDIGGDLIFSDQNLSSNIMLADADSALPNGNTGIVDAINDAYDAATGSGGVWTDAGDFIYPTSAESLGNIASGGSNKLSGLYLGDSSPLVFGADNDISYSFSGTTLGITTGDNDINFDSDTIFIDGSADRVGIGSNSPVIPLYLVSDGTLNSTALYPNLLEDSSARNLFGIVGTSSDRSVEGYFGGTDITGTNSLFIASAADTSSGLVFATRDSSSLSARMVIDPSGNVGIGTTDPDATLEIRPLTGGGSLLVTGQTGQIPSITLRRDDSVGLKLTHGGLGAHGIGILNTSNEIMGVINAANTKWGIGALNWDDMPVAQLHITPTDSSIVGLLIESQGSQTANLFEVNTDSSVGGDLFVITNYGNVGIGTTDPETNLDVAGIGRFTNASSTSENIDGSTATLRLGYNSWTPGQGSNIQFDLGEYDSPGNAIRSELINASGSGISDLIFYGKDSGAVSNGDLTEYLRIQAGGNIGIGTNNPGNILDAVDDVASDYVGRFFNDGNDANRYGIEIQAGADNATGTTYYLTGKDGDGGIVGHLENASGTFQVTDVSDISTKTNIIDTDLPASEIIENLRVVDFNRISDPDGTVHHGFIAQEVQEIFPYAVSENPDTGLLSIAKSQFIPVLVKALQEQGEKIDNLSLNGEPDVDLSGLAEKAEVEVIDDRVSVIEEMIASLHEFANRVIEGAVTFAGNVFITGNLDINGQLTTNNAELRTVSLSNDSAGTVTIPKDAYHVRVTFETAYPVPPTIYLTSGSQLRTGDFYLGEVTSDHFDIRISQPLEVETAINWLAVVIQENQSATVDVINDQETDDHESTSVFVEPEDVESMVNDEDTPSFEITGNSLE